MPDDFPLDVAALRQVLNYLNMGIYITDLDRRIVLWNRKAEEITGHLSADVVGRACHESVLEHVDKDGHLICHSGFCPLYRAMTLDKESTDPAVVFAKKADGGRLAVTVSVAPLHDAEGNVVGGIEAFRDETARIRDLEFAKTIQRNVLPASLPETPKIRFDARYYPHDLVGGDFYDVMPLGAGRYGVLVADVRGHGVSAALYTMCLKSLAGRLTQVADNPGVFLAALNRELSRLVVDDSFSTAFYGVVDTEACRITYANAGHPPPLHYQAETGSVGSLESLGLLLGIVADATYEAASVDLAPGDLLLCFTDGATEAIDKDGKMLTPDGLAELLVQEIQRGATNLLERLYGQVLDFCGDVAVSDDILLLSVHRQA